MDPGGAPLLALVETLGGGGQGVDRAAQAAVGHHYVRVRLQERTVLVREPD